MKTNEPVLDKKAIKLIKALRAQGKSDQECIDWCLNANKFLKKYKRVGKVSDNAWVLIKKSKTKTITNPKNKMLR